MSLLQLQIEHCPREHVETVSNLLDETATLSVTFTDEYDDAILEPEIGTTPLWPNVVIHALYAEESDAETALLQIAAHFPHLSCSLQTLPEKDWERVCMDEFKPQRFGQRLWICPSWLTPPDSQAVNLILDPGLAFGTGTHPTTALCLTWLEQADLEQKTVIDYGCGSGILALAALKLGALHVNAVDIDQQALLATQNNALSNSMTLDHLTISTPDILTTPVDLLIANILLTPLMNLQARFHQLLKTNGTLVVSGVLEEQVDELITAYQAYFTPTKTLKQNGWALLVFTPKPSK